MELELVVAIEDQGQCTNHNMAIRGGPYEHTHVPDTCYTQCNKHS